MKNKTMNVLKLVAMLMVTIFFITGNSFGQSKADSTKMKDCCMMKDGKMMQMKDGKMMPMEKSMTMSDGTQCMPNGECIMKNGKKMKMKEGECMDMSGKMDHCGMMHKGTKGESNKKTENYEMSMNYACPMHPDVTSDKAGKCSKCGMELEKKQK